MAERPSGRWRWWAGVSGATAAGASTPSCSRPRMPTRSSCSRRRRRSSTRSGSANGRAPTSRRSARRSALRWSCTGPRPRTPSSPPTCARRGSSTSPTGRRCTCARCSRAPRCTRRSSPRTTAARSSPRRARARPSLCDPMVDPRGGAYTVGLGMVTDLAVFPYHGTAADHLRERSIDLLPAAATLVGIDEETALDPRPRRLVAGRRLRHGDGLRRPRRDRRRDVHGR